MPKVKRTHPKVWREGRRLTMESAAALVGIFGPNARSTWGKWESGRQLPPLEIIPKIERISEGKVTIQSWIDIKRARLVAKGAAPAQQAMAS